MEVFTRLGADGLVGHQPIYVREYVPLKKLCDPVSSWAVPVSEEYRFFVLDGQVVIGGFYWESHLDMIEEEVNPSFVPTEFLHEVINRVKNFIRFFVVDVARTEKGDWIVIELNDGQQSGLSAIDPDAFYKALRSLVSSSL